MFDGLLSIDILNGPVPVAVFVVAALLLGALLIRRPSRKWVLQLGLAAAAGGLAAVAAWLICIRWLNVFGESLGAGNYAWVAAAFTGIALAVVSVRRRPPWRTSVAIAAVPVFALAAVVGINANYGLNRTVGSLLAIAVPKPLKLAPPSHTTDGYDALLWKHWKAPSGMPAHGEVGTAIIPAATSGFHARQAGLYLPPAALVEHPPPLPLIVMMMGQPGNPDPEPIAEVLDRFAAAHSGLAPVVVVADQLGSPYSDTLCRDTDRFGKAETYVTDDVTRWAARNLPVTPDHRFWTAAGYSNGGLCALSFAIDRPDLFAHILDVSGEEFPGAEHPEATLREEFGGDPDAYDRAKPFVKLRHFTHGSGMSAIFTASSDDPVYHHVAIEAAAATRGAGMQSVFLELPQGGHGRPALIGGLDAGVRLLYPMLGLARPA